MEYKGYNKVFWKTIRPKKGLSRTEKRELRKLFSGGAKVILTDDYSNTGNTFRLLQKTISKFSIFPDKITILAPIHPRRPNVILSNSEQVKIITLNHDELYKRKFFETEKFSQLIKDYFGGSENTCIRFSENSQVEGINAKFEKNYGSSFQTKLKRLYEINIQAADGQSETKKIFLKSVGWGWLGYHAYFAGTRLNNLVPKLIGLRNGILLAEWVDGQTFDRRFIADSDIEKISYYIAHHVRHLKLNEDPRFSKFDAGWGWLEILSILRRAYGIRTGYLKYNSLRKYLAKSIKLIPVLIDGRMNPDEWIKTNGRVIKTDFEQHNFGAPELDIVDPAYDLAAVCFEFQLSSAEEKKLLQYYVAESNDDNIHDRLILYKLLYGSMVNRKAKFEILESSNNDNKKKANSRYLKSWDFLNHTMSSFCSGIIKQNNSLARNKLFFMDIDGVFDTEIFGFPHTTISGLSGIAKLENDGYDIIPNSGRSIENIQSYCSLYNFSGGVAEYGSVIWDNLKKIEIPLIKSDVYDQLYTCRQVLQNDDSIFIDTSYKYSIRAFRYNSRRTEGLTATESKELLKKYNLDSLKAINRHEDTYFVGKEISKGDAIKNYLNYIESSVRSTAAMGDSDEDISMFNVVDKWFAPANCSDAVKSYAKHKKSNITSRKHQQGFYEAVNKLLSKNGITRINHFVDNGRPDTVHRLFFSLLSRAEQPKIKKLGILLNDNKI